MSKAIPFRTAYGARDRLEFAYFDDTPSLTQQNFQNECDINTIMARWEKTGDLSHVRNDGGKFGDFSDIGDYQSALNTVILAQESFMALDASIRARFGNDPADFVSFVQDPSNADALVELGLATRPVLSESSPKEATLDTSDQTILKTASKSISDP